MSKYISEECTCCGRELTNAQLIYVEVDTDNYVCVKCVERYFINVVPVKEMDY